MLRTDLATHHSGLTQVETLLQRAGVAFSGLPQQELCLQNLVQHLDEWAAPVSQALLSLPSHGMNTGSPAHALSSPQWSISPHGQGSTQPSKLTTDRLIQVHSKASSGALTARGPGHPQCASEQLLNEWLSLTQLQLQVAEEACVTKQAKQANPDEGMLKGAAKLECDTLVARAMEFKQAAWELARAR
jgi:hypothetical protein